MNIHLACVVAAGCLACAPARPGAIGSAVTLELATDTAGALPLYPVPAPAGSRKAYAEAVRGACYRIRVHNRLPCRVGLVIAVDGRNIISGAQSWLRGDERMYVLEPYGTQEFQGWRTARDQVNRFYFTTVADSYAGAFGDTSAMGVVAMAVYREVPPPPVRPVPELRDQALPGAPPALGERSSKARCPDAAGAAGTGFGETVYSPSITVAFEPEVSPRERVLVKYEWRETLVRLGLLRSPDAPGNRLWDPGFAPPPPRS